MITFQDHKELVEYINKLGGRKVPIVVLECCETCGQDFASQVQDREFREKKKIVVLCPKCREEDVREKKRQSEQIRRRRRKEEAMRQK